MRYGKKLALAIDSYKARGIERRLLSHRRLKEILGSLSWAGKAELPCATVEVLVREFSDILDDDLNQIVQCVVAEEKELRQAIDHLLSRCKALGVIDSDVLIQYVRNMEQVLTSNCEGLHKCIGEHMKAQWVSLAVEIASIADSFNEIAAKVQGVMSYADINVAGFRKLIKQYYKQIPPEQRMHVMTCTEYRKIVSGIIPVALVLNQVRSSIEVIVQTLSPGVQPLHVVRIGSEAWLAYSGVDNSAPTTSRAASELATRSTNTPSPVQEEVDFAYLIRNTGIDIPGLSEIMLRF
jgi:hypothetical protein